MKKKDKKDSVFVIGKNYYSDNNLRTPLRGVPNTNLDTYSKSTGRLVQRRKFGQNGFATKDYDSEHGHYHFDHVHDYDSDGIRSKSRTLKKKEKREFTRAKRKRKVRK